MMTPARAVARPQAARAGSTPQARVASSGSGVPVTANAVATRAGRSWTTVLDGKRLRQLRRAHGLSQEQLADRARISLATVGRLERQSQASCRGRTLGPARRRARRAACRDQPALTCGRNPSTATTVNSCDRPAVASTKQPVVIVSRLSEPFAGACRHR